MKYKIDIGDIDEKNIKEDGDWTYFLLGEIDGEERSILPIDEEFVHNFTTKILEDFVGNISYNDKNGFFYFDDEESYIMFKLKYC